MSELLDQALELAENGYFVYPTVVRGKDKVPIIAWKTGASRDPERIRDMPWEEANLIGIACEPSELVVIDLDPRGEAEDTTTLDLIGQWKDLVREHEGTFETPVWDPPWVESWSDGVHIYLRADPDHEMACSVGEVGPNIDVRGIGGVAVCYADMIPPVSELPMVPTWLWELNKKASDHLTDKAPPADPKYGDGEAGTKYGLAAMRGELDKIRDAWERDEGDFNVTLNRSAYAIGQLTAGGELETGEAYQALQDLLAELGAPVKQFATLDSGFYSGYDRPRSAEQIVLAERDVEPEELEVFGAKWLDSAGMNQLPPPEWLVPGWLELNSLVQLVGPPGQGKSFIALDLAAKLSRGLPWPEESVRVDRQRVAYISAEGAHGLAVRKRAWEAKHGVVGDLIFYPEAIQINAHEWDVAITWLRNQRIKLIIVDTQARCTVGVDENSFERMSVIVDRVEKLRRDTGACVILVHHTSKAGPSSARGSSVMLGSISTELSVSMARGKIKVRNSKQKNAARADDAIFELRPVPSDDEDWVVPHFIGKSSEEDVAKVGAGVYRTSAVRTLKEAEGPLSVAEILESTGLKDRRSLTRVLDALVKDGLAKKESGIRAGQKAALFEWGDQSSGSSSQPGK